MRKIELHEYQKECIKTIENHFKEHDKQLIQLPTGAGKTFIFLNYLKANSDNALIICPSVELQEQIYKWAQFFFPKSIIKTKVGKNEKCDFYILTAASLNYESCYRELIKKNFDTIVIDEAHRAHAKTYIDFLTRYDKNTKLLGCTATPERLDNKCLLDIFDTLTFDINLYDLISAGYLCDLEAYRIKTGQKLINSRQANGDFKAIDLRDLDNDTRNSIIINTYEEHNIHKKTLIFCLNIAHSEKIASMLFEKGYKACSIHGNLPRKLRANILERFKSGEINVLTNCQLLTEGFDEPSIESLIISRPTRSKALYCQMIGRGVRKHPGKSLCTVYELTDNNHKICTFNVAAGKEPDFQREYKDGVRLTELKKEIDKISIEDIITKKEKYDLIQMTDKGKINQLETIFHKTQAKKNQIEELNKLNIQYVKPISVLEAAFLIWKHKAMVKYGINKKK